MKVSSSSCFSLTKIFTCSPVSLVSCLEYLMTEAEELSWLNTTPWRSVVSSRRLLLEGSPQGTAESATGTGKQLLPAC